MSGRHESRARHPDRCRDDVVARRALPGGECRRGGAITAEQVAGAVCSEVPVGAAVPAWWMGSQAARQCLGEHGLDPAEVDFVAYAGMTPVEEDPWSPAHRLARVLGASRAVAIGLAQMSNGEAAGIGWAATLMQADESVRYALCTTAGNFSALPVRPVANGSCHRLRGRRDGRSPGTRRRPAGHPFHRLGGPAAARGDLPGLPPIPPHA